MSSSGERDARVPRSQAHVRLGAELRRLRQRAGASTRGIATYSSGHISSVESGHATPSVNLIETYIALFGEGATVRALFQQVQEITADARRRQFAKAAQSDQRPIAPQDMTAVSAPADVTRHYIVQAHEADYCFGPTGAIERLQVTALIRAASPHVRLYYTGHFYDADQRPGVIDVRPERGMSPLSRQESENGAVRSYFMLDDELSPTDPSPYAVSYSVEVRSPERAMPLLVFYPRPGSVRLSLVVRFTAPSVPKRLWWFQASNVVNIEQLDERELAGAGGTYAREFDQLIPNWCYGFSWLW